MHYSVLLFRLQRIEEGLAQSALGYTLDPLNPLIQIEYGASLIQGGDCTSSLAVLENVLASDPDNFYANNIIQCSAFQCGDFNRVFGADKHLLPLKKETIYIIERIYKERGFNIAYEEIMRQMEILAEGSYVGPADMAFRYYMINQDDKAIEWIEKGAKVRDPRVV